MDGQGVRVERQNQMWRGREEGEHRGNKERHS